MPLSSGYDGIVHRSFDLSFGEISIDIAEADIVGIAWTPLSSFRCLYFCGLFLVRSMPISEKLCCVEPFVKWAVCSYQKFLLLFVCKIGDIVPFKMLSSRG